MKIIISGYGSAGKTSMREFLLKGLNYANASAGIIQRDLVKSENHKRQEQGLKLLSYDHKVLYKEWPDLDRIVDEGMAKHGRENDNFVADYRLGALFIPDAYKIFLKADEDVRAERLFKDDQNPERQGLEKYVSVEEAKIANQKRDFDNQVRWKKMYKDPENSEKGFDYLDESHYDLIIDTTNMTKED